MKKKVLVTGAGGGIGRATALRLAKMGFDVAVHYRSSEKGAQETLENIEAAGGRGFLFRFDIADREGTRTILESHVEAEGAFWGIVLNAGVNADAAFPGMSEDEWDRVIHTNLDGFYNVLHPLLMPMVQLRKGGRIVTMTSVAALIGNRGQTNYAASKAGLIAASKSLSREVAKRKITVNSVAPGWIKTEMTEDLPPEIIQQVPLRRMGTPEEVAALVGFLFSEEAAYITGQTISINGGLI